MTASCNYL